MCEGLLAFLRVLFFFQGILQNVIDENSCSSEFVKMVGISKAQELIEFLGKVCAVAKFKDFRVPHSPSVFEVSKFQRYFFVVMEDIQTMTF